MKPNERGFNRWLVHIHQHLFNNMVEGESNSFSVVLLPQLSGCYMADILKETYIMKTETLRSYLYSHRPLKKKEKLSPRSFLYCVCFDTLLQRAGYREESVKSHGLRNNVGAWVRGLRGSNFYVD